MAICLERSADLHIAQLMPLPLTHCCFSKIQIGFTFLVPAHLGSPGKGPINGFVKYRATQTKLKKWPTRVKIGATLLPPSTLAKS